MEEPNNPFAAPMADEETYARTQERFARGVSSPDGRFVYAEDGAEFPDRCVKCNAPANGYRKQSNYSWHPSWVFLLLLINVLLYLIVALSTRKQVKLAVGMCEEHRSKRRRWLTVWGIAIPLCAAGFVGGIAYETPPAIVAGIVGMLVSLIGLVLAGRVLVPKKIEGRLATLRGACPAFLLSLSE
ncbi:MAG: hypothetical protein AAGJ46_05795 [Planctomycetota bacterium]